MWEAVRSLSPVIVAVIALLYIILKFIEKINLKKKNNGSSLSDEISKCNMSDVKLTEIHSHIRGSKEQILSDNKSIKEGINDLKSAQARTEPLYGEASSGIRVLQNSITRMEQDIRENTVAQRALVTVMTETNVFLRNLIER